MNIIKELWNMKKLSLALILALPSISAFADIPTQQALESVNKQCSFQVNRDQTYLGCSIVSALFPFHNDVTFQKKFFDVLKKSRFTYTGDPIGGLDTDISPQRIFNGSVITPLTNDDVEFALFDKKGIEYGMTIYYAPYTNKLVIMPHGRKGDVTHKWLGDVQDSNLKKAMIQREVLHYRITSPYTSQTDSYNAALREIKVNLGTDVKFDGFDGFDPNYRLSYERK